VSAVRTVAGTVPVAVAAGEETDLAMRRAITRLVTRVLTGLLIASFGGVFVVSGLTALADGAAPDNGVSATADVVGSVEGRVVVDGIARPRFAPIYEYDDLDGERRRVTDHINADVRPPAVGSTVEISYVPDEPGSVRRTDVDHGWLRWFVIGGGVTAAIGVASTLAALAVGVPSIVGSRRRERQCAG
jgi:hypothetical protein